MNRVRLQARHLVATALLCVAAVLVPLRAVALNEPWLRERGDYDAALEALEQRRWDDFARLRSRLDDYPLAIYLDYYQLTRQPALAPPGQVSRFLERSADSPLPVRFLTTYLRRAGREARWNDFLAVKPDEPNSIDLKCYYFRARLATGDRATAWQGARKLWVHGQSQPKECDPLFDAWQAAGELGDDLVWARLLEAFEQRQRSLMRYVARKGSEALRPWSDRLLAVYDSPDSLLRVDLPAENPYSADIASHGAAHLSRYSPEKALRFWEDASGRLDVDQQQTRLAEHAIALRSLFARTEAHREWLHGALARLGDDKLTGIRLRWALSEQDWPALERTLPLLTEAERKQEVWRYWEAVALAQKGETQRSSELLESVAAERSYYGFLAADRLGRAYAFNHRPLAATELGPVRRLPALLRIGELHFHEEESLAYSEWYKVLQDTQDQPTQLQLMQLANEEGWHRMAIDAATRAQAWDALDIRFPLSYRSVFDSQASAQQVASTELMAIARRESAFYPLARSPVGARGLMQIMPATGAQVAASLGASHRQSDLYEVEHNVLLGSAYYRQLLDRFQGNRVFALTAYNAGPHRVDRWRNKPGEQLPVELWIETIPYQETRNYVQAVLSYNVVFQYLLGDTHKLLTDAERRAGY